MRLDGSVIEHVKDGNIISDGIAFGSIQVPSNGLPIIMMADRQTAGGYTKIATVASVDLPLLAQACPGDKLQFNAITVEESQTLYCKEMYALRALEDRLNSNPVYKVFFKRSYKVTVLEKGYDVTVEALQ